MQKTAVFKLLCLTICLMSLTQGRVLADFIRSDGAPIKFDTTNQSDVFRISDNGIGVMLDAEVSLHTAGNAIMQGNVVANHVLVGEITAPGTPPSGNVVIYAKTDGKLYLKDDGGTETDLTAGGGSGAFSTSGGNAYYDTGDVGFGTQSPTQTVHIAGNLLVASAGNIASGNLLPNAHHTYDIGTSGQAWRDIYSQDLIQTSDRRMKNEIKEIKYGLDAVMALKPVSYKWKHRPRDGRRLGLIAQDVEGVIAEVVNTGHDEAKSMAVRYTALIPVLIKAVQEQQETIERLKKKLQKMEASAGFEDEP